jgi:hypothetical protein
MECRKPDREGGLPSMVRCRGSGISVAVPLITMHEFLRRAEQDGHDRKDGFRLSNFWFFLCALAALREISLFSLSTIHDLLFTIH